MSLFRKIFLLACGLSVFVLLLLSCGQKSKSSATVELLPNGKRLLDTYDSAMSLYYKEVVGSDTLLDGGITCYGEDDSMRYFYLRKGNEMHLLNQSSVYQSPWSLGVVEEEFSDFFLVRLDNGNSSPVHYQVFNKSDGSNRMGKGRWGISINYWKDSLFLLSHNPVVTNKPDSLVLWNIVSGRQYKSPLPSGLPDDIDFEITAISQHEYRISFTSIRGNEFELEKRYRR
ncbi:MAG: hypothetical protein IPG86_15845 [Chitinophagaceae bacterium]|nr:hypothetical protein [Chitinophagaceae bacterium]